MRYRDLLVAELNLLRREGVVVRVLLGFMVAVVAAGVVGRASTDDRRSAAEAARQEYRVLVQSLATQAASGSETARSAGAVAFSVLSAPAVKAQTALEAMAIGQGDLLADTYPVTARGAYHFLTRTDPDNALRFTVGTFDVAFLLTWVLPLLVIGVLFDVVVGERERGVLALAAVAGASPARFVWQKWYARVLVLTGACWMSVILAAAVAEPSWSVTTAWVLTGWLLIASLYLLFWALVALWVSLRARTTESAAMQCTGAWLLLVVLMPALTNVVASSAVPPPSRVELTAALREATEEADKRIASEREQWFFDHPDIKGEMDRQAYYRTVARSEAGIERAMVPLLERFADAADQQQRIIGLLQYLSPGTLTFQTLTGLSGTDGRFHAEFRAASTDYHERWKEFFVSRIERGIALEPGDFARLPVFESPRLVGGEAMVAALGPAAAILVMILFLIALCVRQLDAMSVTGRDRHTTQEWSGA
jgi:ABC-2 type transport system permease protein